ncbi:MAG TPA: hypothetical protein PLN31_20240 [Azoarcus taiwanensis]|uniref:hypothetical protein n=1 Tax=Thauera sp. TaxID=1905334 RepID=UPI002C3392C6|nr:hypothetical protein [Thauera sp.]HRP26647.1 hypothetical protein [Thauera sp.]HRQ59751.1 hypothetical protein [Azoarcus taiwanensis]
MSSTKKPTRTKTAASTDFPRKDVQIEVAKDADQVTLARKFAQIYTSPELAAHRVLNATDKKVGLGEAVDVPTLIDQLREQAKVVNGGDLTQVEAMLVGQATSLQTLFARLTERAFSAEYMPNFEIFLKLALRAQSQSRSSLEALAALKRPPVLIAKQANLTSGPQQVINNGTMSDDRARTIGNLQNELLESSDGKRLDAGAAGTTGGVDPHLATVGSGNGA